MPRDIDELMRLWNNYSASQIAAMTGRSRNAVIGKIHRLARTHNIANGKKLYLESLKRSSLGQRRIEQHKAEVKVQQPVEQPVEPARCTIYQLNDKRCKWPLGELGEVATHFCGRKTVNGRPYCLKHCHAAYHGFTDQVSNR
jgi:GcrA cell cycle regulator